MLEYALSIVNQYQSIGIGTNFHYWYQYSLNLGIGTCEGMIYTCQGMACKYYVVEYQVS